MRAPKSFTARVVNPADLQADWEARALAPGVFYATNLTDVVKGAEGGTTPCVATLGQVGRVLDRGAITTPDTVPTASGFLQSVQYEPDYGDGRAQLWLDSSPGLALSGGKVLRGRKHHRWNQGIPGADWSHPAWRYAPINWVGQLDGTGAPNERRGLKTTVGEGQVLKYVETTIDPDIVNVLSGVPQAPGYAWHNPENVPVVRQFYVQFQVWVSDKHLYHIPRHLSGRGIDAWPKATTLRNHKMFFVSGGQSTDQIAVCCGGGVGQIHPLFYNGNATNDFSSRRTTLGGSVDFACVVDKGSPAVTSSSPTQDFMRRYGPAPSAMYRGTGFTENGVPVEPLENWVPPDVAAAHGLTASAANFLTASFRGYPYGGYNHAPGSLPMPAIGWDHELVASLMRANAWHVIEILVSVQMDAPVNDNALRLATKAPVGPTFVAIWAAPRGEVPVCIGYTNGGDGAGPAWNPARSYQASEATPPVVKFQDATEDDVANCGFVVLGLDQGFPAPTDREFYAMRCNPDGNLPRAPKPTNKGIDPGTFHNFGAGSAVAFGTGPLSSEDFYPTPPTPSAKVSGGQYLVERTEYAGQQYTLAVNPWPGSTTPATAPVHKFVTVEAMGLAPQPLDGFAWLALVDVTAASSLRDWAYGEVIYSMEPVPFPGFLNAELPMPWRA